MSEDSSADNYIAQSKGFFLDQASEKIHVLDLNEMIA